MKGNDKMTNEIQIVEGAKLVISGKNPNSLNGLVEIKQSNHYLLSCKYCWHSGFDCDDKKYENKPLSMQRNF